MEKNIVSSRDVKKVLFSIESYYKSLESGKRNVPWVGVSKSMFTIMNANSLLDCTSIALYSDEIQRQTNFNSLLKCTCSDTSNCISNRCSPCISWQNYLSIFLRWNVIENSRSCSYPRERFKIFITKQSSKSVFASLKLKSIHLVLKFMKIDIFPA